MSYRKEATHDPAVGLNYYQLVFSLSLYNRAQGMWMTTPIIYFWASCAHRGGFVCSEDRQWALWDPEVYHLMSFTYLFWQSIDITILIHELGIVKQPWTWEHRGVASLSHWVTLSGSPAFNTQGSLTLLSLCVAIPKCIIVSVKQLGLKKKKSSHVV